MRELSREFGETVTLAMRFENRIEVVATIESPQLIRMGNTVGRILPPHASSLGKAITSHQTEDVRERLIRSYGVTPFTTHTITDEVALKLELERVRERGYSIDEEESVLEGRCFGVPIFGPAHEVVSRRSACRSRRCALRDKARPRSPRVGAAPHHQGDRRDAVRLRCPSRHGRNPRVDRNCALRQPSARTAAVADCPH